MHILINAIENFIYLSDIGKKEKERERVRCSEWNMQLDGDMYFFIRSVVSRVLRLMPIKYLFSLSMSVCMWVE